ncbi:MAG: oligopeptide transporter, OPT family [Nitrospira sp.]|uniref:OPT family oligopeptide transporter n=1 Tax=Nitrospira sp. ND1 TaxID=1658518 RepID=UPI0009B9B3DD|nr:oligopeptide transporter, OPT family [Nitrospira sp.]MBK7486605.1 oligopeptide transporter, OPT family [Nitrospira sp.]MBP6198928.1 oligopeptide transporter, OPT family [Nitrospira sp.]
MLEQDAPTEPVDAPLVPASVTLPEITLKAVVLSILLAAVLAGANAYLGLFAGMTVSASIPAAVVSMAVLRLFRQSNILENNIVQTAASSGEALAAGVIFTIPGLVLIGYWTSFDYWHTFTVSLVGGVLGVLFTIPLRRALIIHARLRFPEGVATAEVLKVGASSDAGAGGRVRLLLGAAALGGGFKFAEGGLKLWSESLEGAVQLGRSTLYGGLNLSPALVAVGYIIGLNTAVVVFFGGAIGWLILLPLYQAIIGSPEGLVGVGAAKATWSGQIRYIGIGAMLVGGVWTLFQVRGPILQSLRQLLALYGARNQSDGQSELLRTERDAGVVWLIGLTVAALVPMVLLYQGLLNHNLWGGIGLTLLMVVTAFLFSAVAGYMAGLVGSSSNPVSGVTIATIMLASLLLLGILGKGNPAGPAAALLVGAVVCCAAAMGGDNLQDLKTGHVVGATPWKQQVMQVIGVATGAVVIVPVLSLLQAKYGIGEVTAAHPHPLSAPQATLMANLANGVFGGSLPWHLVGVGMVLGVVVIGLDLRQARRGAALRFPVLAVALGMYLPLKLSATILFGGLLAEYVRAAGKSSDVPTEDRGLLCAAGLVTGEALVGILLALPIALSSIWPSLSGDPFQLFADPPLGGWPGLAALIVVGLLLVRAARSAGQKDSATVHRH